LNHSTIAQCKKSVSGEFLWLVEKSYENPEHLQTEDLSIDTLCPKAQGYAGTFGKAHPDDIQHAVDEEQRILQEKKLTVIVSQ